MSTAGVSKARLGRLHDVMAGHAGAASQWSRPPAFADGGAGLVSTVDDYLAFARMLLDNGACGRGRILSRPSVDLMTTDHLTPEQKAVSEMVPGAWAARGWGFGVSVVTERDQIWATPGRYGWDGGYGTSWASDPKEDLIAILMTQRLGFPLFSNVYLDFWTSTYQAIDD
jgi:CubicO group peptidase (beta-lactamase class C family)